MGKKYKHSKQKQIKQVQEESESLSVKLKSGQPAVNYQKSKEKIISYYS